MDAPRTIHFVSLGCPKNRVDSEVMLGLAEQLGYLHVDDPDDADVIVVNTCGFVDDAKKESIDTILAMAAHKQSGRCKRLVLAGCLSQRHPTELANELPEVDFILGSSDMLRLRKVLEGEAARIEVGNPADWLMSASDPRRLSTRGNSAYVKLAEGCNRSCAFCVIPTLRGRQRSRSADDIVAEVEQLTSQGVREVCLISQDTVSWGRDTSEKPDLARLVERIAEVDGLRWVRLHYLYPERLPDGLIELLAGHPRVLPYVDMPLQHASNAMLKRMGRGHDGRRLREIVTELREKIDGLSFRTAFIVGHPGETEEDFTELLDFVADAKFEHVGVFQYSDEETTRSFTQDQKISPRTAATRFRRLMSLQRGISRKHNQEMLGRELDVLVEGLSDESDWVFMGRHGGQAPDVDGCVYLSGESVEAGQIVRATVTQASDYDLTAEVQKSGVAEGPADATPSTDGRRRLPVLRSGKDG